MESLISAGCQKVVQMSCSDVHHIPFPKLFPPEQCITCANSPGVQSDLAKQQQGEYVCTANLVSHICNGKPLQPRRLLPDGTPVVFAGNASSGSPGTTESEIIANIIGSDIFQSIIDSIGIFEAIDRIRAVEEQQGGNGGGRANNSPRVLPPHRHPAAPGFKPTPDKPMPIICPPGMHATDDGCTSEAT